MKIQITHTTDYRYTEPLRYALQTLWLTPQSGAGQTVSFWSVGAPEKLYAQRDAFGNTIQSYTFVGKESDNVRWSLVNAAGQVDT
ncbi:MAG: transglutaminase, partial [Polaromonas sp. 39-63-203]